MISVNLAPWAQRLPRWSLLPTALSFIGLFVASCQEIAHSPHRLGIWFTLALFVAAVVLNELLRPKPNLEDARPKGLGDFTFPTATEDRMVPLIWGRVRIDGPNVIWYGDLTQDAITKKVKTGLWSSTRQIIGFRYNIGVQFALCRGPDVALRRIFIGEKEVFNGNLTSDGSRVDIDEPELLGGDELGAGGVQSSCDFYTGSDTQGVNAYLDDTNRQRIAAAATPTAPRYTGLSYLLARELTNADPTAADKGAYLGNSTQIKRWSFEVERYPGIFSGQSAGDHKIGNSDSNPVNVIYEILTNTEWGIGDDASDLDIGAGSSFLEASNTLISEGNGFSMVLSRPMKAVELLQEIQRQIDGIVFLDHSTGKWTIKLIRDDYSIGGVPQLDETNVDEVRNFTRGSWEDTTNQIQVKFTKRDDNYKESNALAQDMANAQIVGGGTVSSILLQAAQESYPGIMNAGVANNVAWRDLRGQSYPLARATLVINREFWDLKIGDPIAWTNSEFGFTQLPMRVNAIDYGLLQSNKIMVEVVQDIFKFAAASYGDPTATKWTTPSINLTAYPSDEQLAFEAPRGIVVRDPEFGGDDTVSKVLCAARRQAGEVGFQIKQENYSGSPSGSFTLDSEVISFMRIGSLKAALSAGVANPTGTITIEASPDSQSDLQTVFDDSATLGDLGVNLTHLIMVGNELMLVQSAANGTGTDVDLQNVYRGTLDTVQENHSAGADVFLLFVGASLTDTSFPNTNNVDIELRPRSSTEVFSGAVTAINLVMDKRPLRPYSPNAPLYNGTSTPYGTPDVEGDGSGLNGLGFNVGWRRRRFNTTDEVQELLADFTPDSSTEYQVRVFVDPDGVNTEIDSSPFGWVTGTGPQFVNRLELWNIAAAGTKIRIEVETRHDIDSETDLRSRYDMIHDVIPTSARDGDFYLGGDLSALTASNALTAGSTGTFVVNIGAAYSTSDVEYRLNGGAWTTVISAGGTTGNIAGVTSGDTIELRHTVNETPDPQYVEIQDPGAVVVAYGTFSA